MALTSNKYEYSYQDNKLGHHHAYLIKPLFKMINETVSSPPHKINKNFVF